MLVVAEGFVPTYSPQGADPEDGPIRLVLKAHDLDRREPGLVLRGRVVDEDRKPVPRAAIEPFGMRTGTSGRFGRLPGVDPLAVSNERGEFRLAVGQREATYVVKITAPTLAPKIFSGLAPGPEGRELQLDAGVTVTGRIVKDGRPLAGVALGMVQQDRGGGGFLGEFQIATNEDGDFAFFNVPANERFNLYGEMESCRSHGAIPIRTVRTGASGTTKEVGTVLVHPAHRLAGRVVLSDGEPVPAGSRITLSRRDAWDLQSQEIEPDGRFAFEGLPPEGYQLTARVPGYHTSSRNGSFDPLNRFWLIGTIRSDVDGLIYLLDPGRLEPKISRRSRGSATEYRRRKNAPLQGAPDDVRP